MILDGLLTADREGADAAQKPSESHLRRVDEAGWSSNISIQVDRIWRYRWLVAAVALISTITGVAAAASAQTQYTGQAVLSAASPTRSNDDAALAQGYVFIFNDPAYQDTLGQRSKVAGDVTHYGAHTAGLGPVFYVTATSTSADTARSAAAAMAGTFAAELNSQLRASRDQAIGAITGEMREIWGARLQDSDPAAMAAVNQLQQQVSNLNADRANEVTVLQLDAGVSEEGSGRIQTIGLALVAGLLLGCVVAILAGIFSRRLVTDYDVAEKLGLELLDVLPSPTGKRHSGARDVRLRHLVNVLVRRQADRPTAIAIASTVGADAAGEIAAEIATHRVAQGAATVLVHANLHCAQDELPGLAELLDIDHPADIDDILNTRSDGLKIIPAGKPSGDPFHLFDRRRVSAVVDDLRERASFIVFESPALPRFGEAQVISDVTDGTLLVIEQGARLDDAREALRVLDQVGATLIGAVLTERGCGYFSLLSRVSRNDDAPKTTGSHSE